MSLLRECIMKKLILIIAFLLFSSTAQATPIFNFDLSAEGWANQPTETIAVSFASNEGFGGGGGLSVAGIGNRNSYQIVHSWIPDWPSQSFFFEKITFDILVSPAIGINMSSTGMKIKDNDGNASTVYIANQLTTLTDGWFRITMSPTSSTNLPGSHDDIGLNLHIGTIPATRSEQMYIDNIIGTPLSGGGLPPSAPILKPSTSYF